jgi:hypothetical protein
MIRAVEELELPVRRPSARLLPCLRAAGWPGVEPDAALALLRAHVGPDSVLVDVGLVEKLGQAPVRDRELPLDLAEADLV